jgi:hypothetical protein
LIMGRDLIGGARQQFTVTFFLSLTENTWGILTKILAMKRLNYFVRSCICIYVYIHIHMLDKFINIFSMKPYWLVQKDFCLLDSTGNS